MSASCLKLYGLACASAIVLAACGGGGGGYRGGVVAPTGYGVTTPMPTTMPMGGGAPTGTSYVATNLVSDLATGNSLYATSKADPNLINAWGVAFNPQAFVWVANAGTSTSTLYDGNGAPQSLVVAIPPGSAGAAMPTGIVFNGHQDFMVTKAGVSGASAFIFAGRAGTLSGWSPGVDTTNAVTVFDGGGSGTLYTGLAIASQGASDMLYAADFHNGKVDVFDSSFTKRPAAGFADQGLPAGYAPYGIQTINGRIYVSYARQDASGQNAQGGAGQGAVDVFDTSGNLVSRLIPTGSALNAPWGMAMAPADFGPFSGALLVANVGDGKVNAFNPTNGAMMGTLSMSDGNPVAIDGLHGIAFGNGLNNQPTNTLFFAAGPGGGAHGVYGRIDNR
jgi:uncharacterized protein (TIGR03118 family)